MKDRIGYIEWMKKIGSVYQSPYQLEKGLNRLMESDISSIPPSGVRVSG